MKLTKYNNYLGEKIIAREKTTLLEDNGLLWSLFKLLIDTEYFDYDKEYAKNLIDEFFFTSGQLNIDLETFIDGKIMYLDYAIIFGNIILIKSYEIEDDKKIHGTDCYYRLDEC